VSARRLLIMLAAVGGFLLTTPLAANAEPGYPIEPPASSVSSGTVPTGEPVVFSGKGFLANEPISIDISFGAVGAALHTTGLAHAASRTVTASASGTFSIPITLDQSGKVTLTATGTISGVVVNQEVTVVVAEPAGSGGGSGETLPTTGQPAGHWLAPIGLGSGAILLGGLLVFAAKRSRGRELPRT